MKLFLTYRNCFIIGGCFLILVIGGLFLFFKREEDISSFAMEEDVFLKEEKTNDGENDSNVLQVDIKGAVVSPGIYSLEDGSRVIDVIIAAGGMLDNADSSVLNLSKKIEDEMVIVVYTKEEVSSFDQVQEMEQAKSAICVETPNITNGACDEVISILEVGKVSLNHASMEELLSLSGIGESKAKSIISYRTEKGGFQSIEEIMEVKGIGEALFAKIKEDITL